MARFYIENFGCRATQADGAALERQFLERGMERAGAARDAEIVVLNTCTVTEGADKDARASIRRLQRVNPECRILVTGCYAQRAPEELAALPGVTWVVGNSHKHQAAEIAASFFSLCGFFFRKFRFRAIGAAFSRANFQRSTFRGASRAM